MSELRAILGQSIERLLADHVTAEVRAAAEAGHWPKALWDALAENGHPGVLVPEAQGGVGGAWPDAYVVVLAAGRAGAPVPLAETILAGRLLAAAGLDVPDGPLGVAPVRPGEALELVPNGTGWRLDGRAARVPWGGAVGHLAVLTTLAGAPHLALVAAGGFKVEADRNLAGEPRDTLCFAATPVVAARPVEDGAAIRRGGAMLRSAAMAGALQGLLEQSVGYANDRVQFGRPIGKFQAIQQQLAVLAGEASAAASAAEAASRAAAAGDADFEIAVAKIRAGKAAEIACAIAHQVHGAIGFTEEHALHHLTRRLWSWRAEFGGAGHWAETLGREVAARGGDALWRWVTDR